MRITRDFRGDLILPSVGDRRLSPPDPPPVGLFVDEVSDGVYFVFYGEDGRWARTLFDGVDDGPFSVRTDAEYARWLIEAELRARMEV